ncbi:MAG TPA: PKD domain-containing protein [Thermoplasmata archaeon]|nr:PKD domain-containing protein [Thermoplasmata archaeon]
MMDAPPPPPDEELPPPPPEMEQTVVHYPEINVKRSGPFATLRRAVTIFEKDLRTMAKHGLISSIIMVVFLGVVFTISSSLMAMALTFEFGEDGGDGEGINLPGATESVPPVSDPGSDRTVDAGTLVTLDGSGSTDNSDIVYYMWNFQESGRDIELYGDITTYRFMAVGDYEIMLMVVDSSWNIDEASFMLTVEGTGSDTMQPYASAGMSTDVVAGTTVDFNGSASTDDVGVVNWTWTFEDIVPRTLYGPEPSYTFENVGYFWVNLVVRDDAGNTGWGSVDVNIQPSNDDWQWPEARFDTESIVNIDATVTLDASESFDNMGSIAQYTWYIKHNATKWALTGQVATFEAVEWGPYEIKLAVRDSAGNTGTAESTVVALPVGIDVNTISWTATPLGQDVSFNLLTYVYGASLLASVIYIGGLFGKGFAHEIQKGTVKVLFFGPVSVTTVIFSKLLYPMVIGPFFIFPLVLVSMSPFNQSAGDILMITMVSYSLAVLVMVSAAYGSCMIYQAAKRMVLKPTVVTRIFMYLSLLGTMTVFEWFSFLLDMRLNTEMWGDLYLEHGATIATFSPFHQGGVLLSDLILNSGATPDWWVFIIPAVLIVAGVAASHRLYPDLFSRE